MLLRKGQTQSQKLVRGNGQILAVAIAVARLARPFVLPFRAMCCDGSLGERTIEGGVEKSRDDTLYARRWADSGEAVGFDLGYHLGI